MKNYIILLTLLLVNILYSQEFGQNKIQYINYIWQKIQTPHFDVYFYQDGQSLAEFAADEAESSYVKLKRDINYELVDRISIVVYNSHADFEETNISPEIQPTSVGGFTEFFKNRVVLPFEGSYEKFRHVIHHELTHAVSLQFFFGAGPGAVLKGISRLQLPLWFVEGMAEYLSLRWDTESDMYLRDATITGYLPSIPQLSAYMAYKGGQSLYYYIAETYGDRKISEMLWSVRNRRNVERGIQEALRINIEELSKQWQTAMRRQYWPDIRNRKQPKEFTQQLTDNQKWQNFVNNSPAISPMGDKIAFLSDKSGYFDIYLMSTIDTKKIERLVPGQRKSDLEDLNWLTPGISWSGDGKYITFAAKSGREDALNVINVEEKKIVYNLKLGLDAIYSPAWNPQNNQIAFSGLKNGATDIYIYDLKNNELRRLTQDIFSDMEPTWSKDGQMLAFVSDRGAFVEPSAFPKNLKIQNYNYLQTDIYLIDPNDKHVIRVTETENIKELSPEFAPNNQLGYIADENGIFNIFLRNLDNNVTVPLTNLVTGCAQLSWSLEGDRLAFTAFGGAGYNIYLWINPLQMLDEPPALENTAYLNSLKQGILVGEMDYADTTEQKQILNSMKSRQDFRSFIFDDEFRQGRINLADKKAKALLLTEKEYKDTNGNYLVTPYKPKFSIDYAGGNVGYDPFWGVQGLSQIYFSDLLGDQQIGLGINLIQSIKNSDFQLTYAHLPKRTDYYFAAYQYVNFYQTYYSVVRFRNYGAAFQVSYPISRFNRVNAGLNFINVQEENLWYVGYEDRSLRALVPVLGMTADNTIWGFYGPAAGRRWNISVGISPSLGNNGVDFQTITGDFRNYYAFGPEFSLAMRLTGGISFGKQPQRFILGGLDNWLNYKFEHYISVDNLEDLFFANFIMPLRGSKYYEQYGNRFFLGNLEFKLPVIDYMLMRFPLPIGLSYIRGAGFIDFGSAWENDEKFQPFHKNRDNEFATKDLIVGMGYGVRINLGFILLKIDTAWRTDLSGFSDNLYYFSVGQDF